jgi:hypothetical protein
MRELRSASSSETRAVEASPAACSSSTAARSSAAAAAAPAAAWAKSRGPGGSGLRRVPTKRAPSGQPAVARRGQVGGGEDEDPVSLGLVRDEAPVEVLPARLLSEARLELGAARLEEGHSALQPRGPLRLRAHLRTRRTARRRLLVQRRALPARQHHQLLRQLRRRPRVARAVRALPRRAARA